MFGKQNRESEATTEDKTFSAEPNLKREEPKMKEDLTSSKDMNTFIAKGSEFDGKLTFEGTVRIDGKIDGEIFSKGTLIIGPGANINAKVNVESIIISGNVKGNVTASKKIEMRAPAILKGNVQSPSLVIEEGVIFEGSCKMTAGSVSDGQKKQMEMNRPGKEASPSSMVTDKKDKDA
jgi:cytoskeletal protein CcmA (bactofilin family)